MFFVFRVALLDVDVYEPTCATDWGFNWAFRLMLSLPLLFAAANAFGYVTGLREGGKAFAGALSFFINAQASLLFYCLAVFSCRHVHPMDTYYYVEELDTSCETESTLVMRIFAAAYLALIGGVTSALFMRLKRAADRDELNTERVLLRYGFMYKTFRMGALWWGVVRIVKQASLVFILTIAWRSPEDQAVWACVVLVTYAVFASWIRPDNEPAVNRIEVAGNGVTILFVILGLCFTSHRNNGKGNDTKEDRYVIYFAVSQILFLAGACFATGKNILAVRARKRVAARILALRHRIVNAQRSGELSSRRSSRGLIVEGRRASLRKSWGSLGAFTTSDSSFSRRVRLAAARKQRSLGDTERGDLQRHGSFILETDGHCEVLDTFKGPALESYARDTRALIGLVRLDEVVGSAIADYSATGNFSRRHEARFFHKLAHALPGLLDYALQAGPAQRRALADAVAQVEAFDRHRRIAGASPIANEIIEPIDLPSLMHYLLFCSQRDANVLRAVVDGMVQANPRLLAEAEAVRARVRLAERLQRCYRKKQAVRAFAAGAAA